MPAVTVDDILLLPRISEPDPAVPQDRPVLAVTTAPSPHGGEGVPVRRAVSGACRGAPAPFLHMDHSGGAQAAASALGARLRARLKMVGPRYQDIRAGQVALLSSPDGGALVRVIAGEVDGHPGPGVTHTPITLLHATLEPGAQLRLPWRPDFNALGYVLAGTGTVGADRRPGRSRQLALFGPGDVITVTATNPRDGPRPDGNSARLDILVLGGQPIREPVA